MYAAREKILLPFCRVILAASLVGGFALPLARAQSRPPRHTESAEAQATAALRQKLAGIILPVIEFRETTLADAIEFLRQQARQLDRDPDPQAHGVNIFLKLPASAAGGGPEIGRTRITLQLNRVPLLEAMRYIASQAGLKVRVEPYAVSFVPLTENTEELVTATFRVPPGFINNVTTGGGGNPLDQGAAPAH